MKENIQFFVDGDELFSLNGSSLFVSPEKQHVKTMKDHMDDDSVIKHRHTFICPPSKEDVINTIKLDVEKLIVTDPKYKYQITKNSKRKYSIPQSELSKIWDKIEKQIKIELNQQLQKGRITRNKYKEEIGHRTLQEMANYYNNVFSYSRRKL